MTEYATLNGNRIISGSLCFPRYGTWVGDLVLASTSHIDERCEVKIGNLNCLGHKYRSLAFAGTRSVRLLGGYGGWRKEVAAQAYYNARGVKKSMIAGDAASAVGEQIRVVNDEVFGQFFTRKQGVAQNVLRQLFGDIWYVDTDGITQCQERTVSSEISSDFTVIKLSGGKGSVTIATEDVAAWMPGRKFKSPTLTTLQEISMTSIHFDDKGTLRIEVLTSTGGES